jgi:hypothetical protein
MAERILASEERFLFMQLASYLERSKHMRMTELVIRQPTDNILTLCFNGKI